MNRVFPYLKISSVLLATLLMYGCGSSGTDEGSQTTDAKIAKRAVSVKELGPVKVTAEIDPPVARLSDEPKLTVTIDYAKGVTVEKPPFGESIGDFAVLDFEEPLPKIGKDREVIKQIYTLEPNKTGDLFVWPIAVQFTDTRPDGDGKTHIVETEGLTVQIAKVTGEDTPSLDELNQAASPTAVKTPISPWLWWTLAGLFVLLGIGLSVVLILLTRKKEETVVPLTPEQLAFLELQRLVQQNLAETDVKLFYVELTGIVRRYIERTTGVKAPEQTTEEFLREISTRGTFDTLMNRRLRNFLESADLVKFAGHNPRKDDIEEAFHRAKIFIGLEQESIEVVA